jgi:hypothetical protein
MRQLVHILNLETLKVVYFAHFNSLISYGIISGVIHQLCTRYF